MSGLAAWGAHNPGMLFRVLRGASRAVPQVPPIKQLAFLFRRLARAVEPEYVDVEHWGFRLRLRTRGNISESTFLFMPARWDRMERRFLDRHLREEAIFVDVGANAGGYVWSVVRRLSHRCRILAVEPDPDLRGRLELNLRTNGLRNVKVVGVAVGPRSGDGWLRLGAHNRGQNVLEGDGRHRTGDAPMGEGGREEEAGFRVTVQPLPELLAKEGIERIDGLKIDVEGLEPAILDDFFDRAPEKLWPGLILVEWGDTPAHRAVEDRLQGLGYRTALRTRLNLGLRRPDGTPPPPS